MHDGRDVGRGESHDSGSPPSKSSRLHNLYMRTWSSSTCGEAGWQRIASSCTRRAAQVSELQRPDWCMQESRRRWALGLDGGLLSQVLHKSKRERLQKVGRRRTLVSSGRRKGRGEGSSGSVIAMCYARVRTQPSTSNETASIQHIHFLLSVCAAQRACLVCSSSMSSSD